ncbi:putative minor capsid protein [Xiamenia xianingshaonis]|nr:putative minor capsid protein [Xiamenia xianingshaonis]QTU84919.1 minor capsid protein [Xiamenia xianingshaonis]
MPIPRRLLAHDVEVRLPDGKGGYLEAVAVRRVAVQMRQSVCDDEHRSADAGAGVVFLDAVHTDPWMEIPAGARIDFGGSSYYVTSTQTYETVRGQVHHAEVEFK